MISRVTFFLSIMIASFLINTSAGSMESVDSCSVFAPYGYPQVQKANSSLICRHAYVLQHDNIAKIPVWVSWNLTPSETIGCSIRSNAFQTDPDLPLGTRSEPKDYARSGYDKGHIADDGDMSWSDLTERESFFMSNMTPQLPGLNRGSWKFLETATRAWAYERQHAFNVIAGPIYNVNSDKKIGANQVDVPSAFFKIIIDTETRETLAFYYVQDSNAVNDLSSHQTTVENLEKVTGIVFNIPDYKNVRRPIWPYSVGTLEKAKSATCH